MKKILIISLILATVFLSCEQKYDEFGESSLFFYRNGKPIVPDCGTVFDTRKSKIAFYNDSVNIHICGGSFEMTYSIKNFSGKGKYYFDTQSGNRSYLEENSQVFQSNNNRNTFIQIMVIDTVYNHFEAVFEGDYTHNGQQIRITKGRIDDPHIFSEYHFIN